MTGLPSLVALVVAVAAGGAGLYALHVTMRRAEARAAYVVRDAAYGKLARARRDGGDVEAAQKEVLAAEALVRAAEDRLPRRRRNA